jgi:hypothetical protein
MRLLQTGTATGDAQQTDINEQTEAENIFKVELANRKLHHQLERQTWAPIGAV